MNVETGSGVCEPVVVSFSGWMTHSESYWASPDKHLAAWVTHPTIGKRKRVTLALY